MNTASKDLMSAAETADLLRVDRKTIYGCIKSGVIPAVRVGRHFRISRQKVLRLLSEGNSPLKGKKHR